MLTLLEAPVVRDSRPSYRPYCAVVESIIRLSPSFMRIVFVSPDFTNFGQAGLDQRIKLVLPLDCKQNWEYNYEHLNLDLEDTSTHDKWYENWRKCPRDLQNILRTYTVRNFNPRTTEVTIDFAIHHHKTPIHEWIVNAVIGSKILIIGPDNRSLGWKTGVDWSPFKGYQKTLIIGDETATPAICSILEAVPSYVSSQVFIEIPYKEDIQVINTDSQCDIEWISRYNNKSTTAHGEIIKQKVVSWAETNLSKYTNHDLYIWIAGENSIVTSIRRILVQEYNTKKQQISFSGYWHK